METHNKTPETMSKMQTEQIVERLDRLEEQMEKLQDSFLDEEDLKAIEEFEYDKKHGLLVSQEELRRQLEKKWKE